MINLKNILTFFKFKNVNNLINEIYHYNPLIIKIDATIPSYIEIDWFKWKIFVFNALNYKAQLQAYWSDQFIHCIFLLISFETFINFFEANVADFLPKFFIALQAEF